MSEDRLLSALKESESLKESEKPKANISKARTEKVRKKLMNQDRNFLNQK